MSEERRDIFTWELSMQLSIGKMPNGKKKTKQTDVPKTDTINYTNKAPQTRHQDKNAKTARQHTTTPSYMKKSSERALKHHTTAPNAST